MTKNGVKVLTARTKESPGGAMEMPVEGEEKTEGGEVGKGVNGKS